VDQPPKAVFRDRGWGSRQAVASRVSAVGVMLQRLCSRADADRLGGLGALILACSRCRRRSRWSSPDGLRSQTGRCPRPRSPDLRPEPVASRELADAGRLRLPKPRGLALPIAPRRRRRPPLPGTGWQRVSVNLPRVNAWPWIRHGRLAAFDYDIYHPTPTTTSDPDNGATTHTWG